MDNGCDCDCVHRIKNYCVLFDDILGYEKCIFEKKGNDGYGKER